MYTLCDCVFHQKQVVMQKSEQNKRHFYFYSTKHFYEFTDQEIWTNIWLNTCYFSPTDRTTKKGKPSQVASDPIPLDKLATVTNSSVTRSSHYCVKTTRVISLKASVNEWNPTLIERFNHPVIIMWNGEFINKLFYIWCFIVLLFFDFWFTVRR